ncbi:MAG: hypothetical protein HC932_06175 [Thermales bacterium]|nr:hypothetical protein [Thermales bacterium]
MKRILGKTTNFVKTKITKAFFGIGITLFPLVATLPANASPWYQERDGIFGEIKYIRACNHSTALQFKVIAEAGSRNNRVKWVKLNMQSAYAAGINVRGFPIAWTSNYSWRWVNTHYNTSNGDRRWYEYNGYWALMSSPNRSPLRFSIHVNHTGGTTIDLGKIVNLGDIPVGECRTYNDGNLRYY